MNTATATCGSRSVLSSLSAPSWRPPAVVIASILPPSGVLRASLRFHASSRPDPLLVDTYAGCFLTDIHLPPHERPEASGHVLATAFIDGKLLEAVRGNESLRQVVLATDGMDTRPYRLKWPRSTLIFDVSPVDVFREASRMLEGVGAKVSRNCKLFHIPSYFADIKDLLCQKGFSGNRPCIWILQGLSFASSAKFKEFLSIVSASMMEGCIFLGELPMEMIEVESRSVVDITKWMDHTFMNHGFRVEVMNYNEIGRQLNACTISGNQDSIFFVARQLRFSDEQMEKWRMEFQRIEEEGDEEGFEDMLV